MGVPNSPDKQAGTLPAAKRNRRPLNPGLVFPIFYSPNMTIR